MTKTAKKPLAFVLGATANLAFAAGTLILGLQRHLSCPDYEILIISEDMAPNIAPDTNLDIALLSGLYNCRIVPYAPLFLDRTRLGPSYRGYYLYIFECFRLLEQYKTVIWLDCDIAVQGDLAPLAAYGPFAMAPSDTSFLRDGIKYTLGRNFLAPVPGYDMETDFCNSGVMVLQDSLPNPLGLYRWCMETYMEQCRNLRHSDQGILNLLALQFPEFFNTFPANLYNCYPLNPASAKAKIVHSFGACKFWNDGLLAACFPEWARDYAMWQSLGGSAYQGPIGNPQALERGAYPLLCALVDKLNTTLDQK